MSSTAFRPGAYHYRDWVIRALNNDMPYDQFVRMQLAGDMLAPDDIEGAAATGFLVAGPYPGQITAKTVERIRYDQLDDMMMTIGGSMLGLTLGCVRCHEHKYDPIPHQDYYALAASLAQTVHGPRTLDLDQPRQNVRSGKHLAEQHATLRRLSRRSPRMSLPARFTAWHSKRAGEAARRNSLADAGTDRSRSGTIVAEGIAGRNHRSRWPAESGHERPRARSASERWQRRTVSTDLPDASEECAVAASRCVHRQVAATTWTGAERRRKFSTG